MRKQNQIYPPKAVLEEWFEWRGGHLCWRKKPCRRIKEGALAGQRLDGKHPLITVPVYGRYALRTLQRIMESGNLW